MTGVDGTEVLLIILIGLMVLGPKRLPGIANQIGRWIGQARRMTRVMKRQLEDELNAEEFKIKPFEPHVPRDDDTYSAAHGDGATPPTPRVAGMPVQTNAAATEVAYPDTAGDDELGVTPPPPAADINESDEADEPGDKKAGSA